MAKMSPNRNHYRCTIEVNQNGKYCIRLRAGFGRHDWTLPVYFLASSFNAAMKKLERTLQFLQHNEDKLWFWSVDRSDDPNLAGELLADAGLKLDRRAEFPRKTAAVEAPPDKPIPAFAIAPVRRGLAGLVGESRLAAASD
jgi:hypothetical protein